MALFEDAGGRPYAALSWSAEFRPSKDGVLVSFSTGSIEKTPATVEANGGRRLIPKTKIEADGMGTSPLPPIAKATASDFTPKINHSNPASRRVFYFFTSATLRAG